MNTHLPLICIICILFLAVSEIALGQTREFQQATRLMQQQKYEEALPVFRSLYENNPRSYVFFDHYTDCLINLKRFDEAESTARAQIGDDRFTLQASMKLAEILHIRGNPEQALEIWRSQAESNRGNIQAYYTIAASMSDRQEYEAAIELYNKARQELNDDTLFLNELANTYMQAGRFEESVKQYFRLIINSPDQMSLVQQRFLRMQDTNVYRIAAFELEDQLLELDYNHNAYPPLYQLLMWLLLETEEYQRAFVFARQYENRTPYTIHSLFTLSGQLLSAREFELAVRSLEHYVNEENNSVSESIRLRARQEMAVAYLRWGEHLQQNNLGTDNRWRELFANAYRLNEELLTEAPGYDRAERVYTHIIDISLDFLKDLEKARYWFDQMQQNQQAEDESYQYYAEGRIALHQKEYTAARQALTRAHKSTGDSNLSERARYYLSLSDFFAGDYEFAEIQLRSLERRQTSYFANDAIQLRMWIKNGLRADSTGSLLQTIGDGLHAIHTGNYSEALDHLEPVLKDPDHPFSDDLVVELGTALPSEYDEFVLHLIEYVLEGQPQSPLRERLLWDRALIVETFLNQDQGTASALPHSYPFLDDSEIRANYSNQDLAGMFEEIVMEFPHGFYAPFAREKLRFLEPTSI